MSKYPIKNVLGRIISVFDAPIKNTTIKKDLSITDLHEYIVTNHELEKKTVTYRLMPEGEKKDFYKKDQFAMSMPSGIFSRREDKSLIKHSDCICIDIDDLEIEELIRLLEFVIADVAHTIMYFISPSGYGLKIFYGMNTEAYTQAEWYEAYRQYVSILAGISIDKIDKSCKNISRGCFLCSDKKAYLTSNLIDGEIGVYTIDPEEYLEKHIATTTLEASEESTTKAELNFLDKNTEQNFLVLYSITEAKEGPYGSPRQTWILKLACRCNKFGMGEKTCLAYLLKHIGNHPESLRKDKPMDEKSYLYATVKDVYIRYSNDFGKWTMDNGRSDKNTPLFSDEIFDQLPEIFKSFLIPFKERERDMVLLASLGLFSGIMPDVKGTYGGATVYPNLFVFISAAAASGKGCLRFVKMLGDPIHRQLLKETKLRMESYEHQLALYRDPNHPNNNVKPEEPKKTRLFIPGNISASAMVKGLADNNSKGMIFETEADSLSESLGQDWGNFSDLLRKAFHHETVSQMRRANNEDLELLSPALSVVLSGTPKQLTNLIPDPENGLMSRFCFYTFKTKVQWKDMFEERDESNDDLFKRVSDKVLSLYSSCNMFRTLYFDLTSEQKSRSTAIFSKWQSEIHHTYGDLSVASINRLGLIHFRLCMVIAAIRWYEEPDEHSSYNRIICSDVDFNIALSLTGTLMEHTKTILGGLPSKSKDISFKEMQNISGVSKSKINNLYRA
jgi:hypothetical protein